MNRWVILSIFALVVSVSFGTSITTFAQVEHEEYNLTRTMELVEKHNSKAKEMEVYTEQRPFAIDFLPYTGIRSHIFEDNEVDVCTKADHWVYHYYTLRAITDWREALVNVTGDEDGWNFKYHINPKDDSICDAVINYQDTPIRNYLQAYGVVGLLENEDEMFANMTVFTRDWTQMFQDYTEEDWEKIESFEQYQDLVVNSTHPLMPTQELLRVIEHEFGHAFGLDHPYSDMYGKRNPPSIMDYNHNFTIINQNDVLAVVEKYVNGFEDRETRVSYVVDDPNREVYTFYVGERSTFFVDFPSTDSVVTKTDSISMYFFEGGKGGRSLQEADAKMFKDSSFNYEGLFGKDYGTFGVEFTNSGTGKSIFANFEREVAPVDIVVIKHNPVGAEEQFIIENAFQVKNAKYSDLALEYEPESYWFAAGRSLVNIETEKQMQLDFLNELERLEQVGNPTTDLIDKKGLGKY